ncbi:MAG: hypothetical protein RLY86_4164 [Pseudomonadota bacterium]
MSGTGNYFTNFLQRTDEKTLFKMAHYTGIYDRKLGDWMGKPVSFLEIGVYKGGSLRMWRDFFAPKSNLNFIDIDPNCKALEIPGTSIRIGDQSDSAFLNDVATSAGPFDIIVDDGSHMCDHQIASFHALWPFLKNGGIYIVEDVHSSYWPGFMGGHRAPGSFIEFTKNLIDCMHSWYTEDDAGFPLHPLARELGEISFHDSLVFIHKELKEPPISIVSQNGQISGSRKILEIRGRRSVFERK